MITDDEPRVISLIADLPLADAGGEILYQWKSVKNWFKIGHRSLPRPVWSQRGYEHSGDQAWRHLKNLPKNRRDNAFSMYIHVPFCQVKCGFCDLYSMALPKNKRDEIENLYIEKLCSEICAWSSTGLWNDRPVTTIHFGGGTPNFLSDRAFTRIVDECRSHFKTTPQTEWALESTSRLLSREHTDRLKELGFTRLHVGVQTLHEQTRRTIGRRENSASVLEKLKYALNQGLIVSVDVIYGLPGQTADQFLITLHELTSVGVHGFSLYQLQMSEMNKTFMRKNACNREPLLDYMLFQAGEYFLRGKGYSKNHFTHFALAQDESLYYRHAHRGEDLLALGASSDGVSGNYIYRHPEYRGYVESDSPGLEGGMMESALERKIRPVSAALMSAVFTREMMQEVGCDPLLELWLACDMVRELQMPGVLGLTANGSWFITDMLAQIKDRVKDLTKGEVLE